MVRFILNILLNFFILVLVGVFLYVGILLYGAYTNDKESVSQIIDPRNFIKRFTEREEVWKVYESKTFSFEHPDDWRPREASLEGNGGELIDLRIPDIFSIVKVGRKSLIGYSKLPVDEMRPKDLKEESEFIIMERKGYKWVYKREKLFVYEYAISLNTDTAVFGQRLSFYISVESVKEDKELETKLDRLASSVKNKLVD